MRLQPAGRRRTCVPALEALEERAVPACFLSQLGATLNILGSNRADQVAINDNGSGSVVVRCDQDPTPRVFLGINTIDVRTLGGPDLVTYQLSGSVTGNHTVRVDLGAGRDTFNAFLNGNDPAALTLNQHAVLTGSSLDFNLFGRQGKDTMSVDLSGGFTIGNLARLGIRMDGGIGNDLLAVNATHGTNNLFSLGLTQGTNLAAGGLFDVRLLGGPGFDRSVFGYPDLTVANIDATTPSKGTVKARVRGGRAHDNLTLNVRQPAGVCLSLPCGLLIDALIDGGPQSATCHSTSNVQKINCDMM
jgi:hypothetical protein